MPASLAYFLDSAVTESIGAPSQHQTSKKTSSLPSSLTSTSTSTQSSDAPRQPSSRDLAPVKDAIRSLLHQPAYDDGSAGPVLVRLAWHSAGTFDAKTKTGGSNGAGMRYEAEGGDPANAGLQHARAFLEPVKKQFPWVTYADLWTLASVVAIQEMGGPEIPWQGGRTDFADDTKVPPRGRLPDGAKGADHIRWIFYRMGFNDQEIVALSGAHNLGRCHADRSGFDGKWVNNPTRFSNQYFRLLLANEWKKTRLPSGVEQFVYIDPEVEADRDLTTAEKQAETLMMLPSDIALIQDAKFRTWVEKYARDKDLFFQDFARVFGKLLELGIRRDQAGFVVNEENQEDGYRSAPKKSDVATAQHQSADKGHIDEARSLKKDNHRFSASTSASSSNKRQHGAKL